MSATDGVDQIRQMVAACSNYLSVMDRINTAVSSMSYEDFAAFALAKDAPLHVEELIEAIPVFVAMAEITAQFTATIKSRREAARQLN